MPRFRAIEAVSFRDKNGNTFPVKLQRPIETQEYAFTQPIPTATQLDEVASRINVFGDNGETQSWRIFDLNIIVLTEAGFDMTKIRELKIPK